MKSEVGFIMADFVAEIMRIAKQVLFGQRYLKRRRKKYLIVFHVSTFDEHPPCHTEIIIATASELGREAIKMHPTCFGMDLSQL